MYRSGEFIWVRFGSRGRQLAQVVRMLSSRRLAVIRFIQRQCIWTRRVPVELGNVLGLVTRRYCHGAQFRNALRILEIQRGFVTESA